MSSHGNADEAATAFPHVKYPPVTSPAFPKQYAGGNLEEFAANNVALNRTLPLLFHCSAEICPHAQLVNSSSDN